MKCDVCKGACCEDIPLEGGSRAPNKDAERWLSLHPVNADGSLGRCSQLNGEGRCAIYDDRPLLCAVFPQGGPDCLDAVQRLRTPEEYQRIRDEYDPASLEEL